MARVATFGQISPFARRAGFFDPLGQFRYGSGDIAYGEGVARQIKALLNAYSGMVGFAPLQENGRALTPEEAELVVITQRFIANNYLCDRAQRSTLLAKLEEALAESAEWAEEELDPKPTAAQMWVVTNQDGIIKKLTALGEGIATKKFKRCSSMLTPVIYAGAAVGVLWLLLGRKR
ncbi:MAG: hypothetical protein KJO40_13505 [Deltaproteobacteria bacterium]|nr:hypothetical protein [Deltaproteobacteria bacterium]